MKKIFASFILSFILLFCNISKAQTPNKTWLEDYIEQYAENTEDEEAQTELIETLEYYLNNPLNLNIATQEELAIFPFLSEEQINQLFTYIRRKGQMLSIYEIQYINDFDYQTITKLLPFVMVKPVNKNLTGNFKKYFSNGKQNLFLRTQFTIEDAEGYAPISDSLLEAKPNSRYLGNKYKIYTRYTYQYKNFVKYGFTLEKDQGEDFFSGTQKYGYDYMSAHFQLQNQGVLHNLVIGDYTANFGQGLIMYTGFGLSKSAYPLSIKKKAQALRKYSSVNENQFLRGVGATLKFNNLSFTPFFSYNVADANLNVLDTIDGDIISEATSLQITGLHATPSQIEDKNAMQILQTGTNIAYRGPNYNLGITYVFTQFSNEVDLGSRAYQLYAFNGSRANNISF
ncbi:MAG: hypothetical protein KAI79_15210, partial [Bacteroidales bacterium]|nr:hypothetical protein [Bacteroidales bacterium]